MPKPGTAFGSRSPFIAYGSSSVPRELFQFKSWNGSALGFVNSAVNICTHKGRNVSTVVEAPGR